ncbi:archaea-specific SMC-related protein [Natrononativus amylolyticus]|uniref:archaea-specific SMC-related protein n=1 Tax=Natrononativus amylolyticus TaxID=2963434 RepID=UPI0020CE2D9C|nr:archaea-specific SMC-related protein [Natrononativus amylolyticus]
MPQESLSKEAVRVDVENVGGIDEAQVEFTPGVTVLAGRNATNRTSFLRSIMAALGSDDVSLKGDADAGHVELSIGDETYTRTLKRQNGTVTTDGEPYLGDSTLADLFAFLLETNEARQAVARQQDLHELIMRPVDTDAIQADIDHLVTERQSIADELEELDDLERRRTDLESERTRLESEIEETRAEHEQKADELEAFDQDVEETRSEKAELEETLEELNDVRSELESVRFKVETQRESLESLREEREDVEEEVGSLSATPAAEIDEIESRLAELRDEKQEIETLVNDLQRIVRFNESMLEGTDNEIAEALRTETDEDGDLTDQLLSADTVVCWTCGSEVETERIEETIERLRALRVEKSETRRDLEAEISELKRNRSDLESQRQNSERLRSRLERTEREIDDREATLEELIEQRDELTERVATLEDEVESLDVSDEYEEMLAHHREVNQLEFTLDRLEDELASTESAIDEIESRLDERDHLEERLEEVKAELAERRTEIERIETEAVEHFNDHMESVLEILEYSNLERIWIERTTNSVREGRRTVERSSFDLHVIRSTDSDAAYEDTIEHLSESEREVTGLVFALAGYLVHDVYDVVPFILLDSLEAIDSDRIARLVDYISGYADSLVVALLPEDAAALDDEYERVTSI